MSIKTLRKRIALVAVSALGLGLLSVAPAFAGDGDMTMQTTAATGTYGTVGSAVTTDGAQTRTITSNGRLAVLLDAAAGAFLTISSGPCRIEAQALSGAATHADTTITGTTASVSGTNNTYVSIVPTGAGVCVINSYESASDTTANDTITLTVVAATTVGKLSAANSFANLHTGAASAEVDTYTDTSGAARVANGGQGYIRYTLHDENDVAMPTSTVVGCSASGGAVCSFTSATFLGTTSADTYPSADYDTIFVAQGTANTAIDTVVTITVNGAVWITKSLQLLGPVAKLTIGKAEVSTDGGIYGTVSSSDGDFGLKATDSLGRLLTSVATTISGSSYNNSVTGYGTATTGASTSLATSVSFTCSSTAGSADVVATVVNAKNELITSNSFKVYCSGAAYSYSASLDKATYVPGDIATLTVTAKDSKGNPAADSSTVGSSTYPVAIVGSNMTAATAPTNADTFSAGVKKYTFVVGATEGAYQMSVSMPIIDAAVLVPYTIKASSASVTNAEVLSAIVKLIASINKQIRALQKSLRR
jgi:hypothetical protein